MTLVGGVRIADVKVGTALADPDGRLWEVRSMNWALASPPDRLDLVELRGGVAHPSRGETRRVAQEQLEGWSIVARGR